MNWWRNSKIKLKFKEPLKAHTTFRTGGPAKYFVQAKDAAELKLLLKLAKARRLKVLAIGAGSNILASDKGIKALVIKLDSPYFKKIIFKNNRVTAGCGCMLGRIISAAKKKNLSGLEYFSGIPGTLGGAIAMNAGAAGKNIGDLVEEITVMDYNGRVKQLKQDQIKFGYRKSGLAKYIILSARLCCKRKPGKEIEAVIRQRSNWRREHQELSLPSAGSVFKNPSQDNPAGRLIDLCGLRGRRIGGAAVSLKHANFIVNTGNADSRDVLTLMRLIRRRVKNKFNIDLQPEIKIWH